MTQIDERKIADDLRELTRLGLAQDLETYGGLLGGVYGYGVEVDNDVFMMHPFCWCERSNCPWCLACECPFEGTHLYYLADGTSVEFDAYYEAPQESRGKIIPIPERMCGNCRSGAPVAPNFLHKGTGVSVRWYKYIGRGMEIDCPDQETWDRAYEESVRYLQGASSS